MPSPHRLVAFEAPPPLGPRCRSQASILQGRKLQIVAEFVHEPQGPSGVTGPRDPSRPMIPCLVGRHWAAHPCRSTLRAVFPFM
jgi:hypothetical protein